MSDATAYVGEAADWAKRLVRREWRGPGDYRLAMERVAERLKVPYGVLWSLHYRPPKEVAVNVYIALGDALNALMDKCDEDRRTVSAKTTFGSALLGLAHRIAGQKDGALNDD